MVTSRGVSLIAYEGDEHLVGDGGENNAAINALFDSANRDPKFDALQTFIEQNPAWW